MAENEDPRDLKGKKSNPGQSVQVFCPKCGNTVIVYIPHEEYPRICSVCGSKMLVREILIEGKSY